MGYQLYGQDVKQAKKMNRLYMEHFITSRCAPDMLALDLFPNCKEITESWGTFEATKYLGDGYEWNNPDVVAVVVGDGAKPRTAATVAFRTAWEAVSVDPKLAPRRYDVKRLKLIREKVEDVELRFPGKNVVIMAPHSHARLPDSVRAIKEAEQLAVIAIQCCVPLKLGVLPDISYRDKYMWTPENLVKVWKPRRRTA